MTQTSEQEYFDRLTLELNGINPNVYVPMQTIDHNWMELKKEKSIPYVPSQPIERIANASVMLWANKNYEDGNFQCDIYRSGIKQHYDKNIIFAVTTELTPRQHKVWDLVITDAHLNGCTARRAKFYTKSQAKDYSIEFAHYQIWKNQNLIWACLLVEDWIIRMNIFMDQYQQRGNIRMTAPWKQRQEITAWYEGNI